MTTTTTATAATTTTTTTTTTRARTTTTTTTTTTRRARTRKQRQQQHFKKRTTTATTLCNQPTNQRLVVRLPCIFCHRWADVVRWNQQSYLVLNGMTTGTNKSYVQSAKNPTHPKEPTAWTRNFYQFEEELYIGNQDFFKGFGWVFWGCRIATSKR